MFLLYFGTKAILCLVVVSLSSIENFFFFAGTTFSFVVDNYHPKRNRWTSSPQWINEMGKKPFSIWEQYLSTNSSNEFMSTVLTSGSRSPWRSKIHPLVKPLSFMLHLSMPSLTTGSIVCAWRLELSITLRILSTRLTTPIRPLFFSLFFLNRTVL